MTAPQREQATTAINSEIGFEPIHSQGERTEVAYVCICKFKGADTKEPSIEETPYLELWRDEFIRNMKGMKDADAQFYSSIKQAFTSLLTYNRDLGAAKELIIALNPIFAEEKGQSKLKSPLEFGAIITARRFSQNPRYGLLAISNSVENFATFNNSVNKVQRSLEAFSAAWA